MSLSIILGRKDSNLRDAWTKTRCLTTWRRPNGSPYYNKISSLNVKRKLAGKKPEYFPAFFMVNRLEFFLIMI